MKINKIQQSLNSIPLSKRDKSALTLKLKALKKERETNLGLSIFNLLIGIAFNAIYFLGFRSFNTEFTSIFFLMMISGIIGTVFWSLKKKGYQINGK